MTTSREVAPGVHLIQHAHVNCYLVAADDGLTLVDAGLPGFWSRLGRTIREIGRRPADLKALVLTHAHFDHVGMAQRLQQELDLPLWAHPDETYLAAHPYRYAHENPRAIYPIRHPKALPILTSMLFSGALRVKGVGGLNPLDASEVLDVPGRPRIIPTPGHTFGHCSLYLPDRDAIITGDALVTLDPYTARVGPRIVAGAATADSAQALDSLDALARTRAALVLPGHGEPWTDGIASAVDQARAAGPS